MISLYWKHGYPRMRHSGKIVIERKMLSWLYGVPREKVDLTVRVMKQWTSNNISSFGFARLSQWSTEKRMHCDWSYFSWIRIKMSSHWLLLIYLRDQKRTHEVSRGKINTIIGYRGWVIGARFYAWYDTWPIESIKNNRVNKKNGHL